MEKRIQTIKAYELVEQIKKNQTLFVSTSVKNTTVSLVLDQSDPFAGKMKSLIQDIVSSVSDLSRIDLYSTETDEGVYVLANTRSELCCFVINLACRVKNIVILTGNHKKQCPILTDGHFALGKPNIMRDFDTNTQAIATKKGSLLNGFPIIYYFDNGKIVNNNDCCQNLYSLKCLSYFNENEDMQSPVSVCREVMELLKDSDLKPCAIYYACWRCYLESELTNGSKKLKGEEEFWEIDPIDGECYSSDSLTGVKSK